MIDKRPTLKENISITLSDISASIDANNAKVALPLLKWTLSKIQLSYTEFVRINRKSKPRFVERGSIYYAQLGTNIGSEQNGHRPVLVVQSEEGNACNNTVLVIPLTDFLNKKGIPKKILGTHVVLQKVDYPDLKKTSIVKTEHIKNISKNRLLSKICALNSKSIDDVNVKMLISLGIK